MSCCSGRLTWIVRKVRQGRKARRWDWSCDAADPEQYLLDVSTPRVSAGVLMWRDSMISQTSTVMWSSRRTRTGKKSRMQMSMLSSLVKSGSGRWHTRRDSWVGQDRARDQVVAGGKEKGRDGWLRDTPPQALSTLPLLLESLNSFPRRWLVGASIRSSSVLLSHENTNLYLLDAS